jgi:hypothetical protein
MGQAHLKQNLNVKNAVNLISGTAHYFALDTDFKSHKGFALSSFGTPTFELSTWRPWRNALWMGYQFPTGNLLMQVQPSVNYKNSDWNVDNDANGLLNKFSVTGGANNTDFIHTVTTNGPYADYRVQNMTYITGNQVGLVTNYQMLTDVYSTYLPGKTITMSVDAKCTDGRGGMGGFVVRRDAWTSANVYVTGTQNDLAYVPVNSSIRPTVWGLRSHTTFSFPANGTDVGGQIVNKGRFSPLVRFYSSDVAGSQLSFCRFQAEEGPNITAFNPTTTGYGNSHLYTDQANHLVSDTEGTVALWYTPGYETSDVPSDGVYQPMIMQFGTYYSNTSLTIFGGYNQNGLANVYFKGPTNSGWDNAFNMGSSSHAYGTPVHIAITYKNKNVAVYLNGALAYNMALNEAINGWNSNIIRFGQSGTSTGGASAFFEDIVIDRRMWTPEEVNSLYVASQRSPAQGEELRF